MGQEKGRVTMGRKLLSSMAGVLWCLWQCFGFWQHQGLLQLFDDGQCVRSSAGCPCHCSQQCCIVLCVSQMVVKDVCH